MESDLRIALCKIAIVIEKPPKPSFARFGGRNGTHGYKRMTQPKISTEVFARPAAIEAMQNGDERRTAPVFVLGCHRSGTNLLYDMLLSAGGFAIYRGYLPVYEKLIPRFGSFDKLSHRKRMIDVWLRSKGFRRSGLDAQQLKAKVLAESRTGGDFIRAMMDPIAQAQKVDRWAVYNPDNVLHMPKIKADIPNALFVHIIRDGRDIALSLRKMGFRPFPWHQNARSLLAPAFYWQWVVRRGQYYGSMHPADYIEIHYEDLVSNPQQTLNSLGAFLAHDLNYEKIREQGLGRLRESNSSFLEEAKEGSVNPVNRWKERLSDEQVAELECVIGDTLKSLGYGLTKEYSAPSLYQKFLRSAYPAFFDSKLWLKTRTTVGRISDLSILELSDAVAQ